MSYPRYAYVCNGCTPPCISFCREETDFGCDGPKGEIRKLSPRDAAKALEALLIEIGGCA